jgi:hypothetical protein
VNLRKELREQAVEIDRTHRFPLETTRKLGELGIMGVVYDINRWSWYGL